MNDLAPLINVGGIAAVLAWVLSQLLPRMERIELALNRLSKAQMLFLIGQAELPEIIRAQAEGILSEIENSAGNGRK